MTERKILIAVARTDLVLTTAGRILAIMFAVTVAAFLLWKMVRYVRWHCMHRTHSVRSPTHNTAHYFRKSRPERRQKTD